MTSDPDPFPDVTIDIAAPCPLWAEALPEAETLCATAARAALALSPSDLAAGDAELAIVLADDAAVRELNRTWRHQDKPTNVLSFPAADGSDGPLDGHDRPGPGAPLLLGDVVLAFETVAREAREQGKTLSDHLRHLVVHGVLHLLGWDHEEDAEAERMEAAETAVLRDLGIADPYAEVEARHG